MKEIEIPEGYEAKIEGNKVIIESKESEDERIRKILYNFLDSALGKDLLQRKCGLNPDSVLTWFEKQKEQDPAWSEEDEKIRQSLLRDYEYAMQSSGIVWGEDFKKKHNWLKSLSERFNLQLKQKPPKTCTNYD